MLDSSLLICAMAGASSPWLKILPKAGAPVSVDAEESDGHLNEWTKVATPPRHTQATVATYGTLDQALPDVETRRSCRAQSRLFAAPLAAAVFSSL
ncbi:uncharacterized protein BO72DRAFT_500798 [Aspergillus fijiensis CBS 313.89]|uniref:Uncharacterized protein n=1 Tax=Aspergillus fijiensis CBS 313.89 TaxID=1448319 RepID=A0A8G1RJ25_9EURO|nr:uncharacterized protein BO72DRAFT_500798 [Aspergillus fijiensis CBS 313.89]RAK72655.1 hypothetical protein BO72DRAFT_500798 [Aspergillus fijiensis CBS 313.89]